MALRGDLDGGVPAGDRPHTLAARGYADGLSERMHEGSMTDHAEPTPGFGPEWSASRRRASDADLRAWLELGLSACDAADEIAMRWFRRDVPTSTKPDRTFVTEADQAIERLVRERIRAAHPDHGLVGEEYGEEAAGARIRWYLSLIHISEPTRLGMISYA